MFYSYFYSAIVLIFTILSYRHITRNQIRVRRELHLTAFVGNMERVLNQEITKVNSWLLSNKVTLNAAFMIFFKVPKVVPKLNLTLAGNLIEQLNEFKALGITLDQNITWKPHITKMAIKIARVIGVLNKLKHIFPQHILLTIYNSLIQPHLIYLFSAQSINYSNSHERHPNLT